MENLISFWKENEIAINGKKALLRILAFVENVLTYKEFVNYNMNCMVSNVFVIITFFLHFQKWLLIWKMNHCQNIISTLLILKVVDQVRTSILI